MKYDAWFAFEDIKGINTGTGFGATSNNRLVKKVLEDYLTADYDEKSCVTRNTKIIFDNISQLKYSYENQVINGTLFISCTNIGKILKHYYTYTYGTKLEREKHRKKFESKFKSLGWKMRVFLRNPRAIHWSEKHKSNLLGKIYIFLAYDLIDYGMIYYVKLIMKKMRLIIDKNSKRP